MLMQFGFRRKMLYICIAKRREPVNPGLSPLFWLKINDFYLGDRKFYLGDKKFFGLERIFFGLGWCAHRLSRKIFGLEIIKYIKVFRTKKLGFNNSRKVLSTSWQCVGFTSRYCAEGLRFSWGSIARLVTSVIEPNLWCDRCECGLVSLKFYLRSMPSG